MPNSKSKCAPGVYSGSDRCRSLKASVLFTLGILLEVEHMGMLSQTLALTSMYHENRSDCNLISTWWELCCSPPIPAMVIAVPGNPLA